MKLYCPSHFVWHGKKTGSKPSCVVRSTLWWGVHLVSQNCALSSQIFFSLSCSLCFWGEKKLKNVHNLQYALEHSVFENTKAKCEGVSFPTSGTDFVVCCNGAEHISKVLRSVEILPAPPLGGIFFVSLSLSCFLSLSPIVAKPRLPSWFVGSCAEGTRQKLGFRWQLGLQGELRLLEEAGAPRMPPCPFLAQVGEEKEVLIWAA